MPPRFMVNLEPSLRREACLRERRPPIPAIARLYVAEIAIPVQQS